VLAIEIKIFTCKPLSICGKKGIHNNAFIKANITYTPFIFFIYDTVSFSIYV
uniref:Uncharacterized protein n=1 Tax=Oryza brachyantha TaxID=4533 RepID=J3N7H4_ORYBR